MRKIFYMPLMALVMLFFGASCTSPQEEDVFDKSASERINGTISEYHKLLTSSEYGWVFENYPGGKEQNFGGFVHTLKFTDNQVVAMVDLETGTYTSTYKIIQYGGAMLSFDENNPMIHGFSEPDQQFVNGLNGDFEFIFMSHTQDEIIVKGKKYNDILRMFRLKEPAATYMEKVRKIALYHLTRAVLSVKEKGKDVDFSFQGRIFSYKNEAGEDIVVPFIFNDKGMYFYKPIEIDGKKVQELVFDEATVTFKDVNDLFSVTLLTPAPIDFENSRWRFFVKDPTQASSKIKNQYDQVYEEMKKENAPQPGQTLYLWERYMFGPARLLGQEGVGLYFWNGINPSTPGMGGYPTQYQLGFHGDATNPNLLHIKGKETALGFPYEPLIKIRDLFVDNSPYLVERTADPKIVKLTSQKDPEIWMVMERYWP